MIGICEHCGRPLSAEGGIELCLFCNQIATPADHLVTEKTVIECPGGTLYDVETGRVLRGVKFFDQDDFTKGFEIVDEPVFSPGHIARRLIEPAQVGRIARCQSCQDYTVRMRAAQRVHDHDTTGPSTARRKAERLFRK